MIGAWLLLACGGDGSGDSGGAPVTTADSADPPTDSASPTETADTGEPVDPACVDAPLITYATWGEGFVTFTCQGCHGSESEERFGAPEGVHFDDHDAVLTWLPRIRARVIGDEGGMPPAGGVPELDLEWLRIWIDCWDGR